MNRFKKSNDAIRDMLIDSRRPGTVKGALIPVSRSTVSLLFSTPGR